MAPINTRQAAVVDPILSTHARGYRNAEFISPSLFPRAPVPNRAMRQLKFGKESFRLLNTKRAPGSNVKRIQYGYASDPISLVQDALEGIVPIEHQQEAQSVPGVDLGAGAVSMVLDALDLGLEYDCATMARNAANYAASNKVTLTTTARWTQSASTPIDDIKAANEAIRRMTGRNGNTLILGPNAKNALTKHASIKDQFKYTSAQSITLAMLAALLELENVVCGKAVYLPETAATRSSPMCPKAATTRCRPMATPTNWTAFPRSRRPTIRAKPSRGSTRPRLSAVPTSSARMRASCSPMRVKADVG
jgi:hypothetical protein